MTDLIPDASYLSKKYDVNIDDDGNNTPEKQQQQLIDEEYIASRSKVEQELSGRIENLVTALDSKNRELEIFVIFTFTSFFVFIIITLNFTDIIFKNITGLTFGTSITSLFNTMRNEFSRTTSSFIIIDNIFINTFFAFIIILFFAILNFRNTEFLLINICHICCIITLFTVDICFIFFGIFIFNTIRLISEA